MTEFDWDPTKNRENLRKHGVRFETASLVFNDPWILSRKDLSHPDAEERYNALGEIAPGAVLFVVFTCREMDGEEMIRLISRAAHRRMKGGPMKKLAIARKRDIAAIAAKTDATIDFTGMPEVPDWSGAEVGRFYRPPKRPVTMRLDADVVEWLKSYGRGYQTKANILLRHAMEVHRRAGKAGPRRVR